MAEPGGRERAEARAGVLSASARRGGIQDEQRPDRRRAIAGAGMVATASRLLAPSQATSAISSKIEDVAVQLSSPHMRGGCGERSDTASRRTKAREPVCAVEW